MVLSAEGRGSHFAKAVGDDVPGRSRLLLAAVERDRLERVLALLPRALAEGSPRSVAGVLVQGACLLSTARVGWVVLEDSATRVSGGPDAASVDHGARPERWPMVATALGGASVYIGDLAELRPAGSWPAPGTPQDPFVTADGRALRSLHALPISGDGGVRGVLVLVHHRAWAFSERQLALVAALADHLGQVLEVSDAFREQTRVASALQETLLPPGLPELDGVDLAVRYRPTGSGNLVGGDFYDAFADGRGGWYVLLGDASGIGPEAAGLAGVARYTARALAESASGPRAILGHLNLALLRAAPEDRFCTAVLAHFRPPEGGGALEVVLTSAGHPSPILQRAGGQIEAAMSSTGLVLGILPDAPIGEAALTLESGDALVCYTDGVIEAHAPDGDEFGEERLGRVLDDAHGRSAAGIARRVERAVVDYRSPDDCDDLAIVVVRCRPVRA
ncbi:MAG: PP2C family protein-serine/threonine phosphatase [Acidimicrobiales bacterium]